MTEAAPEATPEAPAAGDRPLRVLMIAATPYFADRGCHVRIQGEALALERLGVAVTIATYGIGRDVPGGRISRARRLPGYTRLDASPALPKLLCDALLLGRALGEALRHRPDLIHGHTQEGGLLALVLGRLLGLKVVVDLQSRRVAEELAAYGTSGEGGFLFRLADRFDRAIPRAADLVLTATSAIAEYARGEARATAPVVVLGDAIDVPAQLPPYDPALARRLGLDPERPIVAYLGLLTEVQGIDLLLAAAARLRTDRPDLQYLIMGYPDEVVWRDRARTLGLGDRVVFPGRIAFTEALSHLALARLAVSPKRATTEGNGKLLLYMACGLAVLALDTPVNREILGPDGYYANDDAEAFAAAIAAALAVPAELARRGALLRARAGREASWDARALALVALYRRLIA